MASNCQPSGWKNRYFLLWGDTLVWLKFLVSLDVCGCKDLPNTWSLHDPRCISPIPLPGICLGLLSVEYCWCSLFPVLRKLSGWESLANDSHLKICLLIFWADHKSISSIDEAYGISAREGHVGQCFQQWCSVILITWEQFWGTIHLGNALESQELVT